MMIIIVMLLPVARTPLQPVSSLCWFLYYGCSFTTSLEFYSAFGRNPKNRWSAESVNKLLEGVNLYGEGKWSSIYRSFTFPDNINAMKLKDKWRNLVKYNYVKKSGGKYILS